jgi:hypothetical protein
MTNMIAYPIFDPSYRHDYYSFLVYDETGTLKYSRYNFDYIKYALENNKLQLPNLNIGPAILYPNDDGPTYKNGTSGQSPDFTDYNFSNYGTLGYIIGNDGEYNGHNAYNKLSIWQDFWANINGDYSLPYGVPENMTQYFTPMTEEIRKYISTYGVFHGEFEDATAVDNLLIEPTVLLPILSSELIYFTDRQIRRIQDYNFMEPENNFIYSKYDFDFEQYSSDFQLFDNHLVLFTDFCVRNKVLNGVYNFTVGQGIFSGFKKYFKQSTDINYLDTNSVFTNFYASVKSYYNIDFNAFVKINNLTDDNPAETFMTTYQFQQLTVPFITNKDSRNVIEKSCCTVLFQENVGTGFLIDISSIMNDTKQYVITQSKLFSLDVTTFFAIFQKNGINIKVQCKVVGFHKHADFLLGVFDPLLSYNQTYGINTLPIISTPININNNDVLNGEKVYTLGSYDMACPFNFISGYVTNNIYTKNYNTLIESYLLPESILIDASSKKGCFGGPVWKNDDLGNPILVGMLTNALNDDQMSVACKINMILNTIISNSQNQTPLPINFLMYSRVLGIVSNYGHPLLQQQHPHLNNLSYIGGIYVSNIILGYDTQNNTPIYSINNINFENVKLINNLFIGTTFYNCVLSGKGVVIKSLNGILLGNFPGQRPYSDFTYGVGPFKSIGTKPIPSRFTGTYVNTFVNIYNPIIVEYFYYNGSIWQLTSETIGMNDDNDSIYVEDRIGNDKYVQHKSEFCVSLTPYA